MITQSSAYSWRADVRQSKPVKLIDRVDGNRDNRRIADCSWTTDGWLMLTTADTNEGHASIRQVLSSYLVTIYNVKSGRAHSFRAIGGCFVKNGVVLEHLVSVDEANSRALSSFELSSSAIADEEQGNSLTLNVNDLVQSKGNPHLKLKWSSQLESLTGDLHDTNDQVSKCTDSLLSIVCGDGELIFHLDCTNYKTATFDEGSGKLLTSFSIQSDVIINRRVFSYYFDVQNHKQPAWLLLVGERSDKLEKTVRIELNI
jgi:hypothetical protein